MRQAWTYGSSQGALLVAPVTQNQLHNQLCALCSFSFWQGLGGSRWIKKWGQAMKMFQDVVVVSVRRGPAWLGTGPRAVLEGWCEQPAADWKPCCASTPLCASLYRAIFESAWGDLGWRISGLPEQLIHLTVNSLLTPFLRIPKTQAAQTQAGDELWECLCLWLGEARGSLCLTEPPSPHWGWETIERVSPRGSFWQQSSLVLGLHEALLS